MNILKKFNLSYSSWSVFKKSPLQFYFQHLLKPPKSNKSFQVYGDAGNVVHDSIEYFIKGGNCTQKEVFDFNWFGYDINSQTGIRNVKLDKEKYRKMYLTGCEISKKYSDNVITEHALEQEIYGILVKARFDIYDNYINETLVIDDWKTNSTHSKEMHKDQRLFYSWYMWKTQNIIPLCTWYYLKHNKLHSDKFTVEELEQFDNQIKEDLNKIQLWGMDISKYPLGNYKNPFNEYSSLCFEEEQKRITQIQQSNNLIITMNIKGNFIFFNDDIDSRLEDGIDFKTRFDLPDKYHMQQKVKSKGWNTDLEEVGRIHLYNKRFKCFPIGLLEKVKKICKEFGEYYNKKVKIIVNDLRNKEIMNYKSNIFPEKLQTDKKLRPYQESAISFFSMKKYGIINIATGGGKTFTACEIIRRANCKTLWIIDRKELFTQTKGELEKLLGIEVGEIQGGKIDIKDVTIAMIQTLNTKAPELKDYLNSINFVIVDEFHKAAAETFQKVFSYLNNNKYRLGLTATPTRSDGKAPILYGCIGDIIYRKPAIELINEGYLMKPTINFIKLPIDIFSSKVYSEDYDEHIVCNNVRNQEIVDNCAIYRSKKIIILTKIVEHGTFLCKKINRTMFSTGVQIVRAEHIHGKVGKKVRKQIMQDYRDNKFSVLILTRSIGSEGLDIPDLDVMINASANKYPETSVQILGRELRKFPGKKDAIYIDFVDSGYHTNKHSYLRIKAFKEEGHQVNILE